MRRKILNFHLVVAANEQPRAPFNVCRLLAFVRSSEKSLADFGYFFHAYLENQESV